MKVVRQVRKTPLAAEKPDVQQIPCRVPGCHGKAGFRRPPGHKGYYKCEACGAEYPTL